ncbi:fimbrial biogenesis chaperone [Flocculibacter collagenilyticus]|uniref:hypothetical protein n=1 Tax=Flocculibacter collagenilyticus TaxID=2744479 RepID=UPI0018F624F0|nr:hypothetical protein [Flocculibacter collagenilyticus]
MLNRVTLYLTVFTVIVCTTGAALAAPSIHFTQYRFFFNEKNKSDAFVIFNNGDEAANCKLSLNHFNIDEQGELVKVKSADEVPNAANNIIKFSPRNVTVRPNTSQKVKIVARGLSRVNEGEYVSYLNMLCKSVRQNKPGIFKLNAAVAYNIPMIVRKGKFNAETSLVSAKLVNHANQATLRVVQSRKGNRSLYGDIKVYEEKTDEVIGFLTGASIYTPAQKKIWNIPLTKPLNSKKIRIEYKENKQFGGSLEANKTFKLAK